jgi:hypothetical protein
MPERRPQLASIFISDNGDMNSAPFNGEPVGLVPATPEELAAFAKVLGPGRRLVGALLMYECEPAGGSLRKRKAQGRRSVEMREEGILARGRLRYQPGFEDVWVGDTHFDLRERARARLCVQYLVNAEAFDPGSARSFVDEIDPYVRERGGFGVLRDIRLNDYFNDRTGDMRRLKRELIASAGRNGRYFLRVT